MIYEEPDPTYPSYDTHFYFYDNMQRLIKDSMLFNSTQTEVDDYSYSATAISGMLRYTDALNPQNNNIYKDTGFIDSKGDVIKTNTLTGVSDPVSGYVESYLTTFEYDISQTLFTS